MKIKIRKIMFSILVIILINFYIEARYFNPTIGRFITADNVTPGGGADLQGLNRYSYCINNPLKYVDPAGHEPKDYDYLNTPLKEMKLILDTISIEMNKEKKDTVLINNLVNFALKQERYYVEAAIGYKKYSSLDEAGKKGLLSIKGNSDDNQSEFGFPIDKSLDSQFYIRDIKKGDGYNAPGFEIYSKDSGFIVTTAAIAHSHYYNKYDKERNEHDEYFSGSNIFYRSDYKQILKNLGYSNDEAAGGDISYSHKNGVIMYLSTPSGQMKRYDPFKCEVYNITKNSVEKILPITPGKWDKSNEKK